MFESSSFPFKKLAICTCAVLGMCLWAEDALAQSEQEKVEIENIRNSDKLIVDENSSSLDGGSTKNPTVKQSQPSPKTTPARKENMAGGEGKKIEPTSAPSTLSFNIFLYIVDKFKAD